jgi:hypothetical protein
MDEQKIEQEIQAMGLKASRITIKDIEANIIGELSFTVGDAARALNCFARKEHDLMTICALTLKNGFTVIGESACVSAESFDYEIGYKIARKNAVDKVWALMGYALKEKTNK